MRPTIFVLFPDNQCVVPVEKMLFCLCHICRNEINWVHTDASYGLHGSCCRISHEARPALNTSLDFYEIQSKWVANFSNVKWLYRHPLKFRPNAPEAG